MGKKKGFRKQNDLTHRCRYWALTLANPPGIASDSPSTSYSLPVDVQEKARCCRYALEMGDGGLLHIQMALVLVNPVRFSTVKKWFPGAHIEEKVSRSTLQEFYAYPGKEGKEGKVFWAAEFGDSSLIGKGAASTKEKQKRSAELQEIFEELKAGATLEQIWEAHFACMVFSYRGVYAYYYEVRRSAAAAEKLVFNFLEETERKRREAEDKELTAAWDSHLQQLLEKEKQIDEQRAQQIFNAWWAKD